MGAPRKYRKKQAVIEAVRWFANGDHPLDYSKDHQGLENGELRTFTAAERKANGWEGDVVRYFRHPDVPGDRVCAYCSRQMHDHGFIESTKAGGGHVVCPGDFVITGTQGDIYPMRPDLFMQLYEEIRQ